MDNAASAFSLYFRKSLAKIFGNRYPLGVNVIERIHGGKVLTGQEMYRLCREFYRDLGSHLGKSAERWFDFVAAIPYVNDSELTGGTDDEIVARPRYLLDRFMFPALDCKKKAILIGAWCEGQNPRVPYRFIATSEKPNNAIHHVFTQIRKFPGWVNADPTYPEYRFGEGKRETTFAQELFP